MVPLTRLSLMNLQVDELFQLEVKQLAFVQKFVDIVALRRKNTLGVETVIELVQPFLAGLLLSYEALKYLLAF